MYVLEAVFSFIIVLTLTVQSAETAPADKLSQRQRRSYDYYDYFDVYHADRERSSLNGDGGGFRRQSPDTNFFNPQQQPSNFFNNNGPAFATSSSPRPNIALPAPDTTTNRGSVVFINNTPTVATLPPFRALPTPSSAYTTCFGACQTTPEYNPICASNMQLYFNEQKFNCARNCGLDIKIVRKGSCEGLFPMMRG